MIQFDHEYPVTRQEAKAIVEKKLGERRSMPRVGYSLVIALPTNLIADAVTKITITHHKKDHFTLKLSENPLTRAG